MDKKLIVIGCWMIVAGFFLLLNVLIKRTVWAKWLSFIGIWCCAGMAVYLLVGVTRSVS
jgi:hypothetical protein